jgi:hypothetical protein
MLHRSLKITNSFLALALVSAGALLLISPQLRGATAADNQILAEAREQVEKAVYLVEATDSSLLIHFESPALQRRPLAAENAGFDEIRLAGFAGSGVAGEPDLPQKGVLIALPPGATAVVTLIDSKIERFDGVNVAPGQTQALIHYDYGNPAAVPEFGESYARNTAVYQSDTLVPAQAVALGREGWLRDQRTVTLLLQPVQWNPQRQSLTWHKEMTIAVRFEYADGRPSFSQPRSESDAYEDVLRNHILNYEQARSWRQVRGWEQPQADPGAASPCLGQSAYRIEVNRTGIYAITPTQLANLPANVAVNSLRLCYEAQEIAVKVEDNNSDGLFNGSDALVFYGQSIRTRDTATNVYWLTYGGANGRRMSSASDSTAGALAAGYTLPLHLEEDRRYYSSIPMDWEAIPLAAPDGVKDHWYWEMLASGPVGVTHTLTTTFTLNNFISSTVPITVQVWQGLSPQWHRYEVRVNSEPLGTKEFHGSSVNDIFTANINPEILVEGVNTVAIQALVHTPNVNHQILVNWIKIAPQRQFVAENGRITFSQPAAGNWTYQVSGFTTGSTVEIFNVTDPISVTIQAKGASGGMVSFNRNSAGNDAYSLAATNARLTPLSIVKDTVSSWRNTNQQADYLIITDPSLAGALAPLIARRQAQGLIVKTVYVQDILDEFSYGRYDTGAIRAFLAHTYYQWQSPAPAYVLLAGKGSYDHRNLLGFNGGGGNLVPVFLRSGVDKWLGETATDNQYVAFDSANGNDLAFMMLGRLPAKNSAELSNLVNKILSYETAGPNRSWQQAHFFVTGNAHVPSACAIDGAGDFFETVNDFIAGYLPAAQILRRVYLAPRAAEEGGCYPNAKYPDYEPHFTPLNSAQNRVKEIFSQGNQFVIYTGHSGMTVWSGNKGNASQDYTLLDTDMVPQLTNGNKLSIMLPMTCLDGTHQWPQITGLSEALLKSEVGGAVASYAPTGLQVQQGHDYLLQGFYEAVFDNNATVLGQAVAGAKINLSLNSQNDFYQDLQDTFVLLGDPALRFNIWQTKVEIYLPFISRTP